jgi:hypothetical protein
MSTLGNWRGPNIVKDGLLIYSDPSSPNSYYSLQGGTSLKDISGNVNNGSLTNTPTFSTTVGGMFTFNGTSQYITFGNANQLKITVGTINCWFRATSGNSSYRGIFVKQNAWGLFLVDNILAAFDWGNYYATNFNIAFGLRSTGINLGTNTWTNVAMTFTETIGNPSNNTIIYINGLPVFTTTTRNQDQLNPLHLAYANFTGQYLVGSIAQSIVYNRVLTASEIKQNFNATRSRFGI